MNISGSETVAKCLYSSLVINGFFFFNGIHFNNGIITHYNNITFWSARFIFSQLIRNIPFQFLMETNISNKQRSYYEKHNDPPALYPQTKTTLQLPAPLEYFCINTRWNLGSSSSKCHRAPYFITRMSFFKQHPKYKNYTLNTVLCPAVEHIHKIIMNQHAGILMINHLCHLFS